MFIKQQKSIMVNGCEINTENQSEFVKSVVAQHNDNKTLSYKQNNELYSAQSQVIVQRYTNEYFKNIIDNINDESIIRTGYIDICDLMINELRSVNFRSTRKLNLFVSFINDTCDNNKINKKIYFDVMGHIFV